MAEDASFMLHEFAGKQNDWIESRLLDLGVSEVVRELMKLFASRIDLSDSVDREETIAMVIALPDGDYEGHIIVSPATAAVLEGPSPREAFSLYWESIVDFVRVETGEIRLIDAVGCGRVRMLGDIEFVYDVIGVMRSVPKSALPDLRVRFQFLRQCRGASYGVIDKLIAQNPEEFELTFLGGASVLGQAMALAGIEETGISPVILRHQIKEKPNLSYDTIVREGRASHSRDQDPTEEGHELACHVLVSYATGLDYVRVQTHEVTEADLLRERKLSITGDESVIAFLIEHWTRINF